MIGRPPPGGGAIIAMLKLAGASERTQYSPSQFDAVDDRDDPGEAGREVQ
jgi:hypothetical protein